MNVSISRRVARGGYITWQAMIRFKKSTDGKFSVTKMFSSNDEALKFINTFEDEVAKDPSKSTYKYAVEFRAKYCEEC